MNNQQTASDSASQLNELMPLRDVARYTCETLAAWRKRVFLRRIEFVRCGRNIRVRRSTLEQWLRDRTVGATRG